MKEEKKFNFNPKEITTDPGCYLFYDKNQKILYVGKAKNLRKRVNTYFQKTDKSQKLKKLIQTISKIETRIVNSEMEALILENNLIKEFQPKFNILLRDDKNFLYLKISNEDFPKIEITRKLIRDGSFYFGPKTSAQKFRNTIKFCKKVFKIRTCRVEITSDQKITKNPEKRKIPCLDYHINKCSGPCHKVINPIEYKKNVETMKHFLKGHTKAILKGLHEKMMKYASEKNFEAASKIRDLIQSIEISTEKQTVQSSDQIDRDFIHFTRKTNKAYFIRLAFRNGKLLDQNEIELRAEKNNSNEILIEKFILQFYEKINTPPKEIYLPQEINTKEILDFFSQILFPNEKIEIIVPQKGDKKKLLELAEKNAHNFAERNRLEKLSQSETLSKALPLLTKILKLNQPPKRMECFDISHFGGTNTVASQVVFQEGQPKPSEYRRFKIKTLPKDKIDDFASMNEVLSRRFKQLQTIKTNSKTPFPDLLIIDGGKGQLSAVMKAVEKITFHKDFNPENQIIAIAKQEEEIFRPHQKDPITLPLDSPALKLIQRIRDEAHRFAISFNRSLHKKKITKSILDEIEGIGPATKKKLLKTFGSINEIKKASDKALLEVINQKQLNAIRNNLP